MPSTVLVGATVKAYAPGTVANVGCGFDVIGFALAAPGDTVRAGWDPLSVRDSVRSMPPKVVIRSITGDGGRLSMDPSQNCVGVVAVAMLSALAPSELSMLPGSLWLELEKGLPLGSGLGSSAASSAAAALAVNRLLGEPYTPEQLVVFAAEGERAACGAAHADNVAPAILGGFVLVQGYNPLRVVELPVPSQLYYAAVCPGVELRTSDARRVLPAQYERATLVLQLGSFGGFIAALYRDDTDLLLSCLSDHIAEPFRWPLIPHSEAVRQAAKQVGATSCHIAGSGPTMFSFAKSEAQASTIAEAMRLTFEANRVAATSYHGPVGRQRPSVTVINSESL